MLGVAWAFVTTPRDTGCVPALTEPELILIYTSPKARGRGYASALIEQAERRLRQVRVTSYQVKTVADPSNPALVLYRNRQFTPIGTACEFGRTFQVFARSLDPGRD